MRVMTIAVYGAGLAMLVILGLILNGLGRDQGLMECNKGLADDLKSSLDLKTALVQCSGHLQQSRMDNIADKIGCLTNQRANAKYYLYEVFPLPPGTKEPEPEQLSALCEHQEHYSALRDGTRPAGEGLFTYDSHKGQFFLACKWVQDNEESKP